MKFALTALVACSFVIQTSNGVAQANSPEAADALTMRQLELLDIAGNRMAKSNYFAQNHSPAELAEFTNTVRLHLTNAAAQRSYFFHIHGMTESRYLSNAALYMHPTPWPDSPEKTATLKRCAEMLRTAIDTNQIGSASNKLANQHGEMLTLRKISVTAIADLNEFACVLTNANLATYLSCWGEMSTPTNKYNVIFWSENGPVRQLDKRTVSGRVVTSARFYESGKLFSFRETSPNSSGIPESEMGLNFSEDGSLKSYWERPIEMKH